MPRRILITGANGYLGRALTARALQERDVQVEATWHTQSERLLPDPPPALRYRQCDLADRAAVTDLLSGAPFDAVIHAAALLPDGRPDYLTRAASANVLATAHVAERAAATGARRLVYCSSISVYGSAPRQTDGWIEAGPVAADTIYGWSKLAGEACARFACEASDTRAVSLRLAGIHGGDRRGGALFHFAANALAGRPLTVNNATAPFQLLFIEDAVAAIWRAAADDPAAGVINVASRVFPSMQAFAETIVRVTASPSNVIAGAPGDGRGEVMNTSRASALLQFEPSASDSRLRAYCETLRAVAS
jgi:UDP-glucose 4-epimerase